ncbi:MAG: hypothetical protein ACI86X_000694 [Moritella sp.]|jgi:hypothetical protein
MITIVSLSLISEASVAESRRGTHRSDNESLNRNQPQRNQINLSQDQTMSPTEPSQFHRQKIHKRKERNNVGKIMINGMLTTLMTMRATGQRVGDENNYLS